MGRTSVPGEKTARANTRQWEGLGYFKRQLDEMQGIWVLFTVLPLTHSVLFSRSPGALLSPPADFDWKDSFELLFFFFF